MFRLASWFPQHRRRSSDVPEELQQQGGDGGVATLHLEILLHSDLQCVSIRGITTSYTICHVLSLDVSHSVVVLPFYLYFHQLPMLSIVKTSGSFENI